MTMTPHDERPALATEDPSMGGEANTIEDDDSDWLDRIFAFVKSRPLVWIPTVLAMIAIVVTIFHFFNPNQPLDTDPTTPGKPLSNQDQHVHTLAIDLRQPGVIYLGSHYGLFVSTDDGKSWPQPRGYLNTTMITSLAPSPLAAGTVGVVGTSPSGLNVGQNGIFISHDFGRTWIVAKDPHGIAHNVDRYSIVPDLDGVHDWFAIYVDHGVYETTDDGQTWRLLRAQAPQEAQWDIWQAADNTKTIVIGSSTGLVISRDGGQTWAPVPGISGAIYAIVSSPAAPDTVYASSESGIYRSADDGQTFTLISGNVAGSPFTRLAISDQHPNVIYGLANQQVWVSQNGGAIWTLRSMLNTANPMALIVSPVNDQRLYVGFYYPPSVITSTDGGAHWSVVTAQ
jgi:photosystem II stability/assembly factor-like uncharacterized protein